MNLIDDPREWFKLGVEWTAKEEYAPAEECFRRTLTYAPDSLETLLNLGYVLDMQGRSEEALSCYESVLKVSPENAQARYNRASHLLRVGNLIAGFADYEARFTAMKSADARKYRQPRWDGSPLKGRSILVYCEQGLGDAIQFSRYIPLLAKQGGRVVLEVQQPLIPLLSLLEGVEQVVLKSNYPPLTDVHIPLLSLPHIFQTTLDTIPDHVPYLAAPEDLVSTWKTRIGHVAKDVRIGLAWAGKERPYPNRSCPPEFLVPLLALPDVRFYSLQIGEQDRFPLPSGFSAKVVDLTQDIKGFSDTAALIANLDLIITIDTAVAHLAGAMGKSVWIMLPCVADWRWMSDRDDSPWYPTARLFRQPSSGDWKALIDNVSQAIHFKLHGNGQDSRLSAIDLEAMFEEALKCLENGNFDSASTQLSTLLIQAPDDPAVVFNLGRAYDLKMQFAEAEKYYQQALLLRPGSPAILFCLGKIHLKQKRYEEAERYLLNAHELMPEAMEVLFDLGDALVQQGKNIAALDCCRKLLAINPGNAKALYNLAYLQLRNGDYKAGFANFESRLAIKKFMIDSRDYSQPRWDGAPLEGKSILVFGEQGFGDVIQFSRYLPLLAQMGGKVILEVDKPLMPLFDSFPGVSQVVQKSAIPPQSDVYIQLLSLPHFFGTTLDTVPDHIPYLYPDPLKTADWQQLLNDFGGYRIGIAWRGNPNNPTDHLRSCALADFMPILSLAGVRFFSLQFGSVSDELAEIPQGVRPIDYTPRRKDFSDTAAFVSSLDLVIGVDTAVIHLAGALGKPTWVILSKVCDWRWLVERNDTPWYPGMRVFWQEKQGEWSGVIEHVKNSLEQLICEKATLS